MNEIILELSALFIALFCLIDSLKKRKMLYFPMPSRLLNKLRNQHFAYMALLITLMISAFSSVLEVSLENYFTVNSSFILFTINEIYFIFHNIVSFMFTLYIINMTEARGENDKKFFVIFLTPFFISEVLVLINPLTKIIFYVDENMRYTRGSFMWILYANAAFYVFFGVVYFIKYKNKISKMDRTATLILISIAILGIIIQAIWSIPVELFFESIGFLGFMLLLEDKSGERVIRSGGRFNRSFIVVIALIFVTVITININLIYHAGTDQTGKIGAIQLDNIKGSLQETISEAEGNLLRFSMGMEQLISSSDDQKEIEAYIREQKTYNNDLTRGNCFNVYAAASDWTIIPDFDMPVHYHAVERVWYIGAKQSEGNIYISEPYIDAATNMLCFTLSNILSDGDTVTAMDYTFSRVQDTIGMMSEYQDQTALIVTEEGTIIGCTDTELQGEKISDALPEFNDIFKRVKASNEHGSFSSTVGGKKSIIFSNETSNGWQMILIVDYDTFYADIYRQMVMLGAIDFLMVAVIIVFYMVSINNQEKAENTLAATETFISGFTEDFMSPVNNILKTSEMMLRDEEPDPAESLRDIRESGIHLKEMMNDLYSYSGILKSEAEEAAKRRPEKGKNTTFSSKYIRNGIIGILAFTLLAGLILCLSTTTRLGNTRISKEADKYNGEVSQWMLQHQSILRMFSDVIAANPSILDDYDSAVKWLNEIGQNYSEMSCCYMANPYKEHTVIMNNGWVPEPGYHVEQRQWYLDTERSGDGYSISTPYFDAQTGLYCITFSRVVYSKAGEFLGIFAIDCYVDKLIEVLDDSYKSDGYAFLIDSAGNILNHPNKDFEMSENNSVNVEDTMYASIYHDGDAFALKDYDGSYVSGYAEKSEQSGFTVIVIQNWWSVYGTVIIMAIIFLAMLIISICAVVAMISKFIRWQAEANTRLVEAAETAVMAGKAKSRFLAQMSHEIRTPINAVLGMNEMILRESNDESINEYAMNIQSAGRNLLSLINSILDFSKIEEGKMEIMPVKYNTSVMIENMINSVSQRAADKGLTFETHIDETIPSGLYGDDVRVTQVVVNLLTNAVKYTKKGRVDLYITGMIKDDKNVSLHIRVKDTGIGIKKDDLGKMFESFTRLEETRNRAIEGTGLGMSIVIRLLDMMNSKLEVTSEYGKGSEFAFSVDQMITDITPMGDFRQRVKEISEKNEDDTYIYAPQARVLVVDDNEMNLKVIKNLLKLNGIKPDMVDSGEKALEKLVVETYDIVLLDHMMPKMDGIETLEVAKKENLLEKGTTVIALTANAVVGAKESYLNAGFDDYLSKPVEVKALEAALAKYLPSEIVEYRNKSDNKLKEGEKHPAQRRIINGEPVERRSSERRKSERRKGDRRAKKGGIEDLEIIEFYPENESGGSDGQSSGSYYGSSESGYGSYEEDEEVDTEFLDYLEENGINTEDGLNYCAEDPEFYKEILSDYVSNLDTRRKELDAALENNDLSMYSIKVHAIKGIARTVGDSKVFEMALASETASKAGDIDRVREVHSALLEEYTRKAEIIEEIL